MESAWWAFNSVSEISTFKYSHMREDIAEKQEEIEDQEILELRELEEGLIRMSDREMREAATGWCVSNADSLVEVWWEFASFLIVKYDEGFISTPGHQVQGIGYPEEWLKTTEWVNGPIEYQPSGD